MTILIQSNLKLLNCKYFYKNIMNKFNMYKRAFPAFSFKVLK